MTAPLDQPSRSSADPAIPSVQPGSGDAFAVEPLGSAPPAEVAAEVAALTRAAFAGYASLDPPSPAAADTCEQVVLDAARGTVLVARARWGDAPGAVVGAVRVLPGDVDGQPWLRRVAVAPGWRGRGVASALVATALEVAAGSGAEEMRLQVRTGLTRERAFWSGLGWTQVADHDWWLELARPLPVAVPVPTAEAMRELGRRLAEVLRPGDLVVLDGPLGAGKTTLAQGIGAGLGVRGAVTSPTFVIARQHRPLARGGTGLLHVDAYRLSDGRELDDLDLEAAAATAVTLVEWGAGLVEGWSEDRLDVTIRRGTGDDAALRGGSGDEVSAAGSVDFATARDADPSSPDAGAGGLAVGTSGAGSAYSGSIDGAVHDGDAGGPAGETLGAAAADSGGGRVVVVAARGTRWVGVPLRATLTEPVPAATPADGTRAPGRGPVGPGTGPAATTAPAPAPGAAHDEGTP